MIKHELIVFEAPEESEGFMTGSDFGGQLLWSTSEASGRKRYLGQCFTGPGTWNKHDCYHHCFYGGLSRKRIPASPLIINGKTIEWGDPHGKFIIIPNDNKQYRFEVKCHVHEIGFDPSLYKGWVIFDQWWEGPDAWRKPYPITLCKGFMENRQMRYEYVDGQYVRDVNERIRICRDYVYGHPYYFNGGQGRKLYPANAAPLVLPEYGSVDILHATEPVRQKLMSAVFSELYSDEVFHTARLAVELGRDGLIIQSINSLAEQFRRLFRRRGFSSSLLKVFEFGASAYLGLQWGVAAPMRDYAGFYASTLSPYMQQLRLYASGSVSRRVGSWDANLFASATFRPVGTDWGTFLPYIWYENGGFRLADIWEVVPYSFVVDWFANLGEIFASFDKAIRSYSTPVEHIHVTTTMERARKFLGYDGTCTERVYARRYLDASEVPRQILPINTDNLTGRGTIKNTIDGLALLTQIFSG